MTLSCGWRLREQTPCPGPVLLMVDRDCTSPGVSACCSGDAGRVARGRPVPWTAGNLGRSRGLPQIWGGPVGCRKFGRSCGCRNFWRSRGLSEISGGPVDCRKFRAVPWAEGAKKGAVPWTAGKFGAVPWTAEKFRKVPWAAG